MPSARLIRSDYLHGAALLGVVDQDPSYPAANALHRDRYKVWRSSPNPPNQIDVDVDLGAAKVADAVAVIGLRTIGAGGSSVTQLDLFGSVDGVNWGTVLAQVTQLNVYENRYAAFTAASRQFWRFRLTVVLNTQFEVGKLFLGKLVDIGAFYDRGSRHAVVPNRVTVRGPAGVAYNFWQGPARAEWENIYGSLSQSLRNEFDSLAREQAPFVYVTPTGTVHYAVLASDGRIEFAHLFGDPNVGIGRYASSLAIEELP